MNLRVDLRFSDATPSFMELSILGWSVNLAGLNFTIQPNRHSRYLDANGDWQITPCWFKLDDCTQAFDTITAPLNPTIINALLSDTDNQYWLEIRNAEHHRREILRINSDMYRAYAAASSREILVVNCSFTFECSRRWETLTSIDTPDVRFCGACRKNVHLARNQEQLEELKREGVCVAVRLPERPQRFTVGELRPRYSPVTSPDSIDKSGVLETRRREWARIAGNAIFRLVQAVVFVVFAIVVVKLLT